MIDFTFEETESIPLPHSVENWLENIIIDERKKPGPVSYILCSDEYLLKINRQYLAHDYFTDIITFDYVKGKMISGDIFVSLPRISDNAVDHNNSFESELLRVFAHGILHLCGYGDKLDAEQAIMTEKEDHYVDLYYQKYAGI